MRDVPLSACERNFLLQSILNDVRVDGRTCDQYRSLKITLGLNRGSCFTELGQTKVFVVVSCEVVTPTSGRPTEGIVRVNLELNPTAAPQFEAGRLGESGIEILRLLERNIKESRCMDQESLCIKAGEKVWLLKIDVYVLNDNGSIIDCASIGAIAALMHFRRPDVTVCGEEFTVHPPDQRDPVPLNIYHIPVCITMGFTEKGKCVVVDPTDREERILEGNMVIGVNSHKEVCTLHYSGNLLLRKDQVLQCSRRAVERCIKITDQIKKALAEDAEARSKKIPVGFAQMVLSAPDTLLCHKVAFDIERMEIGETPMPGPSFQDASYVRPTFGRNGNVVFTTDDNKGRVPRSPLLTEQDTESEIEILQERVTVHQPDLEIVDERPPGYSVKVLKPSKNTSAADNVDIKSEGTTDVKPTTMGRERRKGGQKAGGKAKKLSQDVLDLLDDIEQDVVVLEGAEVAGKATKLGKPRT